MQKRDYLLNGGKGGGEERGKKSLRGIEPAFSEPIARRLITMPLWIEPLIVYFTHVQCTCNVAYVSMMQNEIAKYK